MLGGSRYGVPVADVARIVRHEGVQTVPSAPPAVEGVVTLAGEVVPVLDMRSRPGQRVVERPGLRGGPPAADRRRIVVLRVGSRTCGLTVDEVHEIVDVDEPSIEAECPGAATQEPPAGESPRLPVKGTAAIGTSVMLLPDLAALLDLGRMPTEPPE